MPIPPEAAELANEANSVFVDEDYDTALDLYTQVYFIHDSVLIVPSRVMPASCEIQTKLQANRVVSLALCFTEKSNFDTCNDEVPVLVKSLTAIVCVQAVAAAPGCADLYVSRAQVHLKKDDFTSVCGSTSGDPCCEVFRSCLCVSHGFNLVLNSVRYFVVDCVYGGQACDFFLRNPGTHRLFQTRTRQLSWMQPIPKHTFARVWLALVWRSTQLPR